MKDYPNLILAIYKYQKRDIGWGHIVVNASEPIRFDCELPLFDQLEVSKREALWIEKQISKPIQFRWKETGLAYPIIEKDTLEKQFIRYYDTVKMRNQPYYIPPHGVEMFSIPVFYANGTKAILAQYWFNGGRDVYVLIRQGKIWKVERLLLCSKYS